MILVTGATGILGRVIVLELLKQGKEVRAAKRERSNIEEVRKSFHYYEKNADSLFSKIQWQNADFEDQDSLQTLLRDITEVYHCAAKVSFNPRDKKEIYHTNIEGTRNLLYACTGLPVKKFCHISSIAVLDGLNEARELDEESEFNSKTEHSAYAKSKYFSEMEVWRASAEGLNTIILNPGIIIGSGNWHSSSGEMFPQLIKSPFTTSGSSSYVDVRDVAKAAIGLMEQEKFGERFVVVSETRKMSEVADFVRKKAGKPTVKILPDGILQTGRFLNFLLGWAFPDLRLMNKVNIEAVTSHNILSNKKIKSVLNLDFIPVENSLDFHLNNYLKTESGKN